MSEFRFAITDRVNVPNFVNVQGVIVGLGDHIIHGKTYLVSWVSGAATSERFFTAEDMAEANKPPEPQSVWTVQGGTAFDPVKAASDLADAIIATTKPPKAKLFGKRKMKVKPRRKR